MADENLVNSMQQKRSMKPRIKGRGEKREKETQHYFKSYFLISWMKASYVTVQLQPALVTWFTIVQFHFLLVADPIIGLIYSLKQQVHLILLFQSDVIVVGDQLLPAII